MCLADYHYRSAKVMTTAMSTIDRHETPSLSSALTAEERTGRDMNSPPLGRPQDSRCPVAAQLLLAPAVMSVALDFLVRDDPHPANSPREAAPYLEGLAPLSFSSLLCSSP